MKGKKLDVSKAMLTWKAGASADIIKGKRSLHLNVMLAVINDAGEKGITGDALCTETQAQVAKNGTPEQLALYNKYTSARHVAWVAKRFVEQVTMVVAAPEPEAAPAVEAEAKA